MEEWGSGVLTQHSSASHDDERRAELELVARRGEPLTFVQPEPCISHFTTVRSSHFAPIIGRKRAREQQDQMQVRNVGTPFTERRKRTENSAVC